MEGRDGVREGGREGREGRGVREGGREGGGGRREREGREGREDGGEVRGGGGRRAREGAREGLSLHQHYVISRH